MLLTQRIMGFDFQILRRVKCFIKKPIMNNMDYKEKYEQALGRAKELISKWTGKNKDFYVQDYAYIFPELAESDDERIRMNIYHTIEQCSDILAPENQKRMLAWLEKQKDKNCLACDQHLKGYLAGRKVTEEEKQKD